MAKRIGYGSQLQLGDGESPEEFTAIPGLKDFEFPRIGTIDDVDVTTHDSPDGYKEYIPGLKEAGDFDVEIVWDPDDEVHAELEDMADARETRNFRAVDPASNTYEFSAYIRELTLGMPVGEAYTASMALRLAGAVTRVV